MKSTSRRLTAVLLAAMLGFTSFSALNAYAAETDGKVADAAEATASASAESTEATTDPAATAATFPATLPTVPQTTVPETTVPETTVPATTVPAPQVGRVTGLGKNTTNVNNINMVWNAVEGADGYVIYRCSADYDKGAYRKVAEVKTNTYNDTKLVQGSPYYYKIAAYKNVDGKKVTGEFTLYKTATQPAKVLNVLRVRSSETLEISWSRNNKASGYKIFRADGAKGGEFKLVKLIESGSVTRFADTNVRSGSAYQYKVVAFRVLYNSNWYHSPGSSITSLSGLCAPNFNFSSQLYTVSLNWKYNAYATRYDIYYSTNKNAPKYTYAGSTTGNTFTTDTRFSAGSQYYFRVYPIYKNNGVTITGTAHSKLVTISNRIFDTSVPTTYIEVDVSRQRMWLVKNLSVLVDTPVVTGMRGSADTPKGYYEVYQRATDTYLYGADYVSHVDFWMGFYGGYGIHDASWRDSFGGNIYTYDGSHGCVNTPYNAVSTIYYNTGYGTPVIVH